MLIVIVNIILLTGLVNSPALSTADEHWLMEQYHFGRIDTLQALMSSVPETTGVGQFIRGIFEPDGEKARFYFDRILTLYSSSAATPWALERLWQYHFAKGDVSRAQRYFDTLKRRTPNHPCASYRPVFKQTAGLKELQTIEEKRFIKSEVVLKARWAVQMGAFSLSKGAKSRAREVRLFGKVQLKQKRTADGQVLTLVLVGSFTQRGDAALLAERIKAATGLDGRVVSIDN